MLRRFDHDQARGGQIDAELGKAVGMEDLGAGLVEDQVDTGAADPGGAAHRRHRAAEALPRLRQ